MKLQLVPAAAGARWFRLGLRTFARQPLAMGALFFGFIVLISVPSIVPVLGFLIALALVPAGTVGLMAGAKAVDAGTFPPPFLLFTALRQGALQTRRMLVLGAIYAAAIVAAIALSALVDGGKFAQLYIGHTAPAQELATDPAFRAAMWFTVLLYLPISLAFWHAPALVHWHAVPPLKSIFFSIVAVLRNAGAFLLYGLLWFALSSAAGMALLALAVLTGNALIVSVGFLFFGLLVAAMFFTSIWFTFRDCFAADDDWPLIADR